MITIILYLAVCLAAFFIFVGYSLRSYVLHRQQAPAEWAGRKNPIVCVDFDGVLHSYDSGWQGAAVISDPPVPGAINWLMAMSIVPASVCAMTSPEEGFRIAIYSSRSKESGGVRAMKKWLIRYGLDRRYLEVIAFPTQKPAASLTIDDRAWHFTGFFPSKKQIKNFTPWNKK